MAMDNYKTMCKNDNDKIIDVPGPDHVCWNLIPYIENELGNHGTDNYDGFAACEEKSATIKGKLQYGIFENPNDRLLIDRLNIV